MDLKATFTRALQGELGQYEVTFTTTDKTAVLKLKTQDRQKVLDLTVKEHREKRSLDANAYFHVLCQKIADALMASGKTNVTLEDVKAEMVLSYGTIATLEDGSPFKICLPKGAKPFQFYPYCRWIGENKTGQGDWYICYKQTHTLDEHEMYKLIKATIEEAQALGIDTRTPEEIADALNLKETIEKKAKKKK